LTTEWKALLVRPSEVSSASLDAYRQPDAGRALEIEEARRNEAAETRRVVAAMKNPFHGLRPDGPGAVGLILSVAAILVPLVLTLAPLAAFAVHSSGRVCAALAVLECGSLAGLAGAALGVAGMVRNQSPFASVLAFLAGSVAPFWALLCAVVVGVSGNG
jgi:hypothetical protein